MLITSPVSIVDGYDLPMRITNTAGCPVADCAVDLIPNCQCLLILYALLHAKCSRSTGPAPLKGPYDSNGYAVGCNSACKAGLAADPGTSLLPQVSWRESINSSTP